MQKIAQIKEKLANFEQKAQVLKIEEANGNIHISYKGDDLDYKAKREFEENMISILGDLFDEDTVFFIPVSQPAPAGKRPATQPKQELEGKDENHQLKVGHGSIGAKKKIQGIGKVISIGSGKGGVGKSSVTLNLALALIGQGKKVGVIDADIYGPSFPTLMAMTDAQVKSKDKMIIPLEKDGLKMVSFGNFINEKDAVIWRGPMLGGVLEQFFFQVNWGELDYLLIDLPPGTGDIQLSMVQKTEVDAAIVVSTPQDLALADSRRAVGMFQKLNIPVLGMIENMSYFICDGCEKKHYIFGQGGVEKESADLGVEFLGGIPFDQRSRELSDRGEFYFNELADDNTFRASFMNLANKVIATDPNNPQKSKKGFFSKMFKM